VDDALARLSAAGFDLVHAFDAHAAAHEPGWERLAGGPRLGLLVGNTRALWPVFSAHRRAEPDPLDRYTERSLTDAYPGRTIYFSHRAEDGAFLPFTRLAVAVGFAALAPSHLVIHPIYGPWIALRALVVIDGEPPARAPIPKPCVCADPCRSALAAALPTTDWRAWLAVRDACTIRAHRYDDEQIRFHYPNAWRDLGPAPSGG
jgi:methylmalonic aciduria homocystinuria type C protein